LQLEKHLSLMTSTLAGIKRLFNPLQENAYALMCGHCYSFSNVIDLSDLHSEKQ
jgi:hypothetical protein